MSNAISPGNPSVRPSDLAPAPKLTDRCLRVLRSVRRRALRVQLAEFPVRAIIAAAVLGVAQALADWIYRFPWQTRRYLLVGDGLVFAYLFWAHVIMPYRRRLSVPAAALLIERRIPQFRTALISAVQLTHSAAANSALLHILVQQVDGLAGKKNLARQVVRADGLKKRVGWMIVVLLLAGAAAYGTFPLSLVLGRRLVLLPASFPSRTAVRPVTTDALIPDGSDLTVSARAEGVVPKDGRLTVAYDDGRKQTFSVAAEPGKPDVFSYSFRNVRQPFRYQFSLNDGEGEQYRVQTRVFLALADLKFTGSYPPYTGLPRVDMSPGNLAIMAGGRVWIRGNANQPLKAATLTVVGPGTKIPMQINGDRKQEASLDYWNAKNGITGFSIHLESISGEQSVNDPVYHVDLTVDRPPVAAIRTPKAAKITVVTDDKLPITFSVRDDFGIKKIELVYEIYHEGTFEGDNAPAEKGRIPLDDFQPDTHSLRAFTWDLASLLPRLVIGYSGNFWIEAHDNDDIFGPNVGQSKKVNFTVVSEEDKKAELAAAMEKEAAQIEHLYQLQHTINQKADQAISTQTNHP